MQQPSAEACRKIHSNIANIKLQTKKLLYEKFEITSSLSEFLIVCHYDKKYHANLIYLELLQMQTLPPYLREAVDEAVFCLATIEDTLIDLYEYAKKSKSGDISTLRDDLWTIFSDTFLQIKDKVILNDQGLFIYK